MKGLQKMLAYMLAFCMAISLLPVHARAAEESTTVYFYNSGGWTTVGAHAYANYGSDDQNLTGDWGSTTMTADPDTGEGWYKVTINAAPGFSLIVFDKDGNQNDNRTQVYIENRTNVYITLTGVYASAEAAISGGSTNPTVKTTVYFYNSGGWRTIGAHAYANYDSGDQNLTGDWGTTTMAVDPDTGEGWYKVTVNAAPGFSLIIFDKDGDQENNRTQVNIENETNVYVTLTGVYASAKTAEDALNGEDPGTTEPDPNANYIYFLNSSKWENVGAYIYGDKGELLGGFTNTTAVATPEIGGDWVRVEVSELPPYSIIFYNKENDSERTELYLPTAANIYVTITGESFTSKEDAEAAVQNASTTIYFLNWDGEKTVYDEVYAHAYIDSTPIDNVAWPGVKAEKANDLGENWWKIEIKANASITPFKVIFNNGSGEQLADIEITSYKDNYVTAKADQVYTNQTEAEKSVGIVYETVVYFLNDQNWSSINAYVYGKPGEALGGWPGATAVASELGEKWVQVTVPAQTPFNIIFFNTENPDNNRAELLVPDESHVYIASNGGVYTSQLEAELDVGLADPSLGTTLHFYNYRGWLDINGYFFTTVDPDDKDSDGTPLGSGWPGKAAEEDVETGAGWWKIFVPKNAEEESFWAIFNDGVNQTDEIQIKDKTNVYITPGGQKFATAAEAEVAAAEETLDDGCEEGPNADISGYNVTYSGAGADLPYVTYEAEAAVTNAEILPYATDYLQTIQSEASGRQAVELKNTGDYVEFTLTRAANSLVLRYSMPDNADGSGIDATLSLYINGTEKQNLALTSKYAWVYGSYPYFNVPSQGKAHRFFDETRLLLDETLPAGTTIKLQKDAGDTADYYVIDFIECELVGPALTQPANSLSVTDYGAVANDGQDDYQAFVATIAAAKEQGKSVWIPAGTFDLVEMKALKAEGVTIQGAGMWYSNLNGAGAAFQFSGTSKFYDFAMTGVSTIRRDDVEPAGFENSGRNTNVTIQNIWMEHMKVGVWTANTERMAIQGCRIRNTYADGINLCSGTKDSIVRNNSLRNTGDDCIAMWPWLANETGNTIEHNTIQVPTLANGVAIYGGGDHVVSDNYIADIINNGAGIVVGSEFDTPKGYTGTVTVKNNVLYRCGSMQTDENYMIGAIWIWNSFHHAMNTADINVYNNEMYACPQVGITIEHNMDTLTGLNIQNNKIDGAKHAVFSYLSGGGSATIGQMDHKNITGDEFVYAENQGAAIMPMKRVEDGGKVLLKGDKSAFILEIADQEIDEDDPGVDDPGMDDPGVDDPGVDDPGKDTPSNPPSSSNTPSTPNRPSGGSGNSSSSGTSSTPSTAETPSTPSDSNASGSGVTTDTKMENGESTVTTTAKPDASVSGSSAFVSISASMGSEIVTQAQANSSATVIIEPQMPQNVTKADVTIAGGTLSELSSKTNASVEVKTPAGNVTLPHGALAELGKSGDVTISVETKDGASIVDIIADGSIVDKVPGGVKVGVPLQDGQVVVVVGKDGKETIIPKSLMEGGMAYAVIDGSATIKVIDNSKQFDDVKSNDWFSGAVDFASSHELFNGVDSNIFAPNDTMNRAMLATVLWRLESQAKADSAVSFPDVDAGKWYTDGVVWASTNGIVRGMDDGTYQPDRAITREEIAVMLYRYAEVLDLDLDKRGDVSTFSDGTNVSDWARTEVEWAVGAGLLRGSGENDLQPGAGATRAQVATMLQRFVELIVK